MNILYHMKNLTRKAWFEHKIRIEHVWFAVWTYSQRKYVWQNTTRFGQILSETFHYWLFSQFSQKDLAALLFAEFNHARFQAVWETQSMANMGDWEICMLKSA